MQPAPVTATIASRIRRLREERGWTAERLAEECTRRTGVVLSRSTIAKIETGHRKTVTATELTALATVLEVTTDFLTTEAETGRPVTILHLSDLQFGADHPFGGNGLLDPELHAESLRQELYSDLDGIVGETGPPGLVLVTGDITDSGAPREFEQARSHLTGLIEHLGLRPERLVLVPGGHDVTRAASRAYFADCEADDLDPAWPYWPKWRHYARLFKSFYPGP